MSFTSLTSITYLETEKIGSEEISINITDPNSLILEYITGAELEAGVNSASYMDSSKWWKNSEEYRFIIDGKVGKTLRVEKVGREVESSFS